MKTYPVSVTRNYHVTSQYDVSALSSDDAKAKAIELSNNEDHSGRLQLGEVETECQESQETVQSTAIRIGKTNWKMLGEQKLCLIKAIETASEENSKLLQGLLHFVDHIQDQAAITLGNGIVFTPFKEVSR